MYKKYMVALIFVPAVSSAASFDCKKASTYVEHSICENSVLSVLDEKLSVSYKANFSAADPASKPVLKQAQQMWLKEARNQCASVSCIEDAYRSRIAVLEHGVQSNQPPSAAEPTMSVNEAGATAIASQPASATEAPKVKVPDSSQKPASCEQWAAHQGQGWQEAKFDMVYRPLAKAAGVPVRFTGEVLDADPTQLAVYHDETQANFVVQLPDGVQAYNPDEIKVGGYMSGYGTKVGSLPAELVDGRETTIPVIQARCIQAN